MNSLLMAIICFVAYLVAYYTYGRYLGEKIFKLSPVAKCPSGELRDDVDFVPAKKEVLFGHHFTSIAGLGPILGPAIAIIWGWVPALLWIVLGSIFMGAVHDFGSLVVSMRAKGRSLGDLVGDLINPRVRQLFLWIIFFELWLVIAIFALLIAILLASYPQAVIPVWFEIPIALWLGYMVYTKRKNPTLLGIVAVIIMYITVIIGAYWPIKMPGMFGLNSLMVWMVILFIYSFIASTVPIQKLLQPRDYINGHQLLIALALLFIGTLVAHPTFVAPALNASPKGAPLIIPMLFVVIACGAISGFHSLVSSGTSSKQCDLETNAKFVGYGGMLMEGALSVLVVIACGAGLGLGLVVKGGEILTGTAAFTQHYATWAAAAGLKSKVDAVVIGSANLMASYGIPMKVAITIMGVFLVSFAATTLDTATRIQRYVISELGASLDMKPITGRYVATFIAVITAMILAFYSGDGKGALTLWPLFGTVNQLLAGLALLVLTIYLLRKQVSIKVAAIPFVFMVVMDGWAMLINIRKFAATGKLFLFVLALIIFVLMIWMIVEALIATKIVERRAEVEPFPTFSTPG
ncbi:MAG: carbon starvation protein A [Syntrophobacterales bacterium]|nr:MAG: carbon starvation protein A [Syntrophobacterales bacterium]